MVLPPKPAANRCPPDISACQKTTVIGLVGLAAGALIGKKTRAKVKPAMIKKAVYAVMAVSGIVNIVTAVVALV